MKLDSGTHEIAIPGVMPEIVQVVEVSLADYDRFLPPELAPPQYGERVEPVVLPPLRRRKSGPVPAGRHVAMIEERRLGWNLHSEGASIATVVPRLRMDRRDVILAFAAAAVALLPILTLAAGHASRLY